MRQRFSINIKRQEYTLRLGLLFFLMVFGITLRAQVTIGSTEAPVSGASLQLKEIDGVSDGNINSYKGFGLPRVNLTDLNNLYPMFLSDPADPASLPISEYSSNMASIKAEHTGLLVLNIGKTNTDIKPGVYYWNGTAWVKANAPGSGSSGNATNAVYGNLKIVEGTYTPEDPYIVQDDDAILLFRMNRINATEVVGSYNALNIANAYPYINPNAAVLLPDPTTCPGRIIRLINDSHRVSANYTIIYVNYPMYAYDGTNTYNSRPNYLNYLIQSYTGNGSQWTIMSNGTQWFSMTVVIQ